MSKVQRKDQLPVLMQTFETINNVEIKNMGSEAFFSLAVSIHGLLWFVFYEGLSKSEIFGLVLVKRKYFYKKPPKK